MTELLPHIADGDPCRPHTQRAIAESYGSDTERYDRTSPRVAAASPGPGRRRPGARESAGSSAVVDNLTAALTELFGTIALRIVGLVIARDALRVGYLAPERDLARLPADAEVDLLAPDGRSAGSWSRWREGASLRSWHDRAHA
ncbi:hypothetical protein ACFYSF_40835 [Streptomyces canus]|uniref:hypothetical protein n=1 Tax=Streptomyces canus TaxID=58343 RepID=UPI0036C60624